MNNISLPCHWDAIRNYANNKELHYMFSESSIISTIQAEYWQRMDKWSDPLCFKNLCLSFRRMKDVRNEVSEYHIVREILWSLQGATSNYVFQLNRRDTSIHTRLVNAEVVCVHHLSYHSLDSMLSYFARCSSSCLLLRNVIQQTGAYIKSLHPTVVAFAYTIGHFLGQFDRFLNSLELKCRSTSITLLELYRSLLCWQRRIDILFDLIIDISYGNLDSFNEGDAHIRILDALHQAVEKFNDCCSDEYLMLLHSTFVKCFQPFLCSLNYLLTGNSPVIDYFNCLFLNEQSLSSSDPLFWFQNFSLNLACWSSNKYNLSDRVPRIIHPVLHSLIRCLKSLCLLKTMSDSYNDPCILHKINHSPMFSLQLSEMDVGPLAETSYPSINVNFISPTFYHQDSVSRCITEQCDHPVVQRASLSSKVDEHNEPQLHRKLLSVFPKELQRSIGVRCKHISEHLMTTLLTPCVDRSTIGGSLVAMASVFLFGASDRMNDFTWDIFKQISSPGTWYADHLDLTLRLRSQFDSTFFMVHEKFSFEFVPKESEHINVDGIDRIFCRLSSLHLTYMAEWPANIIVDTFSVEAYNHIFLFLLKVKYAKWCLENLRFSLLQRLAEFDPATHHRMLLVRAQMLYVFTNIHDFLMHRIGAVRLEFARYWNLPDTSFEKNVPNGEIHGDLTHLRQTHTEFLLNLQSLCLFDESQSPILQEILTLYSMGHQLRALWFGCRTLTSVNTFDLSSRLIGICNSFSKHVNFLTILLSRSIRFSNAEQLIPLTNAFNISASFNYGC